MFLNAFGIALGQHLVEHLGLEWMIAEDDQGSEIAVWGRAGDVLVFPPNLVAKRYVDRIPEFFEETVTQLAAQVMRIRAQQP
jgi:hypothetical protein